MISISLFMKNNREENNILFKIKFKTSLILEFDEFQNVLHYLNWYSLVSLL